MSKRAANTRAFWAELAKCVVRIGTGWPFYAPSSKFTGLRWMLKQAPMALAGKTIFAWNCRWVYQRHCRSTRVIVSTIRSRAIGTIFAWDQRMDIVAAIAKRTVWKIPALFLGVVILAKVPLCTIGPKSTPH